MAGAASGFHVIVVTVYLPQSRARNYVCEWASMHAYVQLSCVYLMSTLNVTHVKKCTRLSSSLAGRVLERDYSGF